MGNAKKNEKSDLRGWVAQWGFSILVGLAALVGAYVAWKVPFRRKFQISP
jgi:hypothetical protein